MAAPRPGNEDRAWNDPPLFSYNSASQTTASTPRIALNKRVPFPITTTGSLLPSSDEIQSEKNVVLLPPKVSTSAPETCPVASLPQDPQEDRTQEDKLDEDKGVCEDVDINNIQPVLKILNMCLSQCENTLQKRTVDEVRRRLGVLEVMWNENKLDCVIKRRMHQLGNDLESGHYDDANSIHLGLIVDYPGQVTPWMVGVKHLIHQSRSLGLNAEAKPTLEETSIAD